MTSRKIIRADGTEQDLDKPHTILHLEEMIGAADSGLDTVTLAGGLVMLVDDLGHAKGLPVNAKATALYHARCIPGTTHQIRGDVAIVPDADFGPRYG